MVTASFKLNALVAAAPACLWRDRGSFALSQSKSIDYLLIDIFFLSILSFKGFHSIAARVVRPPRSRAISDGTSTCKQPHLGAPCVGADNRT